ncbi:MAG: hypothetical protein AAFN63_07835 [Pseudomonadota bacterium]
MNTQNFKMTVLSLFIVVGCALSAAAGTLSASQIRQGIIGQNFEAKRMGMVMKIAYSADGRVSITSAMMNTIGRWHLDGDQLCVTFESGPRRGTNCSYLTALEDGAVQTSEGLLMRPSR